MNRIAQLLHLISSLGLLLLVILVFRQPLVWLVGDRIPGAAGDLSPAVLLPVATDGFHLEASSEPSGASLRINGREHGATPFIGNVVCAADETVLLEVEAPGLKIWQRSVPCRHGEVLQINARLQP